MQQGFWESGIVCDAIGLQRIAIFLADIATAAFKGIFSDIGIAKNFSRARMKASSDSCILLSHTLYKYWQD